PLEAPFLNEIFQTYYRQALRKHADRTGLDRHRAVWSEVLPMTEKIGIRAGMAGEFAPDDPTERVWYAAGLGHAMQSYHRDSETNRLVANIAFGSQPDFASVGTESLMEYFQTEVMGRVRSLQRDDLFEEVWRRTQTQ